MIRFDAYSATTVEATHDDLLSILVEEASGGTFTGLTSLRLKETRGFHTFGSRMSVSDETGAEIGSVQWGGRQGNRAMIEVKGEHTPACVNRLRERFPHRCTRVDACADWDAPQAFEDVLGPLLEVKTNHRLYGQRLGDWDDHPELGRTFMLGSPASPLRARLYEKGKQPEYRHLARDNWTRLELQVRPAKEAKDAYASLSPEEVWGASRWTRDLASKVLQAHVSPHPAGTVWRQSSQDRAIAFMCKQYGAHLVSLAADLGGWKELGLTLGEIIKNEDRPRSKTH